MVMVVVGELIIGLLFAFFRMALIFLDRSVCVSVCGSSLLMFVPAD